MRIGKLFSILTYLVTFILLIKVKSFSKKRFSIKSILSMTSTKDDDDVIDDYLGAPVGPLPTVSSNFNFRKAEKNPSVDLWIVGGGTLGSIVAEIWKSSNPKSVIVAETLTNNRHDSFKAIGVVPKLRSSRNETLEEYSARNVLICLPPSGSSEYEEELFSASRLWAGEDFGNMVFTSSTVVYGDQSNTVNEEFRLDSRSGRAKKMITAEEAVMDRGGSIIRLAGLYNSLRGPHTYWLKNGTVDGNADGVVNMLHYEDAATAVIAALQSNLRRQIYLACDDAALTREEICRATLQSGLFENANMPNFKSPSGPRGKICDSAITRNKLQWKPKYLSFAKYMRKLGGIIEDESEDMNKQNIITTTIEIKPKPSSGGLWLPGDDLELGGDII